MDRHGLVTRQKHSRTKTEGTLLSQGSTPNALWCTEYKGEFMMGDKRYGYPLTVSDHASRNLLLCEAMESVKEQGAFTALERLFKERGLPLAIRSDQWRALRLSQWSVQLEQTRRLVAAARRYHRAHPAWLSSTERPP